MSWSMFANPGRQIQEWLRIVRPGGLVYMVVPDKRFCFDRRRELTEIEYLLDIHGQELDVVPIGALSRLPYRHAR